MPSHLAQYHYNEFNSGALSSQGVGRLHERTSVTQVSHDSGQAEMMLWGELLQRDSTDAFVNSMPILTSHSADLYFVHWPCTEIDLARTRCGWRCA